MEKGLGLCRYSPYRSGGSSTFRPAASDPYEYMYASNQRFPLFYSYDAHHSLQCACCAHILIVIVVVVIVTTAYIAPNLTVLTHTIHDIQ